MSVYEQLQELLKNNQGELTTEQIADLVSKLTDMQKGDNKSALSELQLQTLMKCTQNRSENLVCPHCGSIAIFKNGKRNGRQRYFCKDCHKSFGDTYGTMFYHSKLKAEQWLKFIELTIRNQSLRTIRRDMKINIFTAWYNRHKLCSLIMQLQKGQDSFYSITEGDEYYLPMSYKGKKDKDFFLQTLGRLPYHHRDIEEWTDYFDKAGYSLPFYEETEEKSLTKQCLELNALPFEEKKKRGISNNQLCVLTCIDREEHSYLAPVCNGRITPKNIEQHLKGRFSDDAILVTDSHSAYKTFANRNKVSLRQIPSGKHRVGGYNLARVDSFHSRLDTFVIGIYKGIASKYIDHYLALFRWQDKHRKENTNSKQEQLMNMLTFGVKQVNSTTIMDKTLPFEVKGVALVNGCVV